MVENKRIGAVGALLDEYERVLGELKLVLERVTAERFIQVQDPSTSDPDCRSVQTVMNHVVRAGYGYSIAIRKQFGDPFGERREDYGLETSGDASAALDAMFTYCEETLSNKGQLTYADIIANQFTVSWGQTYDFEQMMEHAIVHVMRHRRQIERWGL